MHSKVREARKTRIEDKSKNNMEERNFSKEPETAAELQDFLTLAAVIEARAYPISAKWYQNEYGVKMTLHTRSKDPSLFNENGRHEIEALKRMEDKWRERLGL